MVDINRDKAAQMGITVDQIRNTFYSAFGTRQISTIYEPSNSYEVILELDPTDQQSPTDLSKIYVRASSGQMVPLAAVASISEGIGPVTINHQGQLPSVTISFNLQPGFSLGTRYRRDRAARARGQSPGLGEQQLSGQRPGLPASAARPGPAAHRGGDRHLHRARHSLRELHPSDHDLVRLAGRGARRAAHADALPSGS